MCRHGTRRIVRAPDCPRPASAPAMLPYRPGPLLLRLCLRRSIQKHSRRPRPASPVHTHTHTQASTLPPPPTLPPVQLEGVGPVAMRGLLLEVLWQVDDHDGIKGALLRWRSKRIVNARPSTHTTSQLKDEHVTGSNLALPLDQKRRRQRRHPCGGGSGGNGSSTAHAAQPAGAPAAATGSATEGRRGWLFLLTATAPRRRRRWLPACGDCLAAP